MALTVNSNIQALNAYRNLNKTQAGLSASLEKLSSGLRINRAADDAAGLAISEGLKAQIGGIQQASKNAQDGISLVQTADGALSQSQAILQRLRTLAVQSANGSQSDDSRAAINAEASALKAEITRISDTSSFNSVNLLDGTYQGGKDFQIGYKADGADATGNTIRVAIDSKATASVLSTASVTAGASVTSASGSYNFSASTLVVTIKVDGTEKSITLNGNTSSATGLAASLNAAFDGASGFNADKINFSATTNGAITVTSSLSGSHTVQVTSVKYDGAEVGSSATFGLASTSVATGTDLVKAGAFTDKGLGVGYVDLSTQAGASSAITSIDNAIKNVSTARASLGALQNRFQYTVDNLDTTAENLSAAQSRITDTDMASEMVSFTRAQILSQAGTSMLSQAKNLPSSILDLLRG